MNASRLRDALRVAVLSALLAPLAAPAADNKVPSERVCRNVEFPLSEVRLVRECDAQYRLCASPPPAWQQRVQVMQVCAQIEAEQRLQSARAALNTPSNAPAPILVVPPGSVTAAPPSAGASVPASGMGGTWKINGNGHAGDVLVQQAADGTLAGTLYGQPLYGYHANGERIGVWLRGTLAQPMQAYVGQLSADGAQFAGRIYGLNGSTSGATLQRNLFAFAAQRGAVQAPALPGLPVAAAGPAHIGGTLPLVANGYAGQLVLVQAADGGLSGSMYGDRISGHYAPGSGSVALLRFAGAQPIQLYLGTVTAQGISGEFFALSVPAGATPQRMRFAWSAQASGAGFSAAPSAIATAQLQGAQAAVPAGGNAARVTPHVVAVPGLSLGGRDSSCGVDFATPCAVAADPATVGLRWAARADAQQYRVLRNGQEIARVAAPTLTLSDDGLAPGTTATYVLEALRATGTVNVGTATGGPVGLTQWQVLEVSSQRSATTPALGVPGQVRAESVAGPRGRVRVAWTPAAGANGYLVYRNGAPLPIDPQAARNNATYDTGVPLGRHSYMVESLFITASGRRVAGAARSAQAAVEVAFPVPRQPFLTLRNGQGSLEESEAHYAASCGLRPLASCRPAHFIDPVSNREAAWFRFMSTGDYEPNEPDWPRVLFYNDNDLNAGRNANCARRGAGPTVCWTTTHPAGLRNFLRPENGGLTPVTLSVIVMQPDGRAFFGIWDRPSQPLMPLFSGRMLESSLSVQFRNTSLDDREHSMALQAVASLGARMDSQGRKGVPQVCLACHGGRYDPASRMVVGASLLPIVPERVHFESREPPRAWDNLRMLNEGQTRRFNHLVRTSNPAPAIAAQIDAMYGNQVHVDETRARDGVVPPGWRGNEALYQKVIGPYCANCHFAQRGALSLASAQDLRALREGVFRSVCVEYTMPHSEPQFRRFWMDEGLPSPPDLLATWLGYGACSQ